LKIGFDTTPFIRIIISSFRSQLRAREKLAALQRNQVMVHISRWSRFKMDPPELVSGSRFWFSRVWVLKPRPWGLSS
jgi:hypothetical protein